MRQITDDMYIALLSCVPQRELTRMLCDGEVSPNDARAAADRKEALLAQRFVRLPPPDHGVERGGQVKWPWFSARRRGHLLEQQVSDLSARVAHLEQHLITDMMQRAKEKA